MPALSNDITVTINKFLLRSQWRIFAALARARWRKNSGARKNAFSGGKGVKQVAALLVILAGLTLGAQCALAQAAKSQVERLYVIDCGTSVGPDKSRWTPGVDVGKPLDMVGNCYLIRHA